MSAAAAIPSPCAAVHALCDHLAEVQAVLSLIASHPATPEGVRGRCLGLWYKIHDAHVAEADAVDDVARRLTGRATELRR